MGMGIIRQSFLFLALALAIILGFEGSLGAHSTYAYETGHGGGYLSGNSVYTISSYGRLLHSKVSGGYAVGNRVYTINGLYDSGLGSHEPVTYVSLKDGYGERVFPNLGPGGAHHHDSTNTLRLRNVIGSGHGVITGNLGRYGGGEPYATTAFTSGVGNHRSLGGHRLNACTSLFNDFNHGRNIRHIDEDDVEDCEDYFDTLKHESGRNELSHIEGFNDCRQMFQDFNKDHDVEDISPSDVIGCQDFFVALKLYS